VKEKNALEDKKRNKDESEGNKTQATERKQQRLVKKTVDRGD
jgi:hypothetical protein